MNNGSLGGARHGKVVSREDVKRERLSQNKAQQQVFQAKIDCETEALRRRLEMRALAH
jgi:hypothetical protein